LHFQELQMVHRSGQKGSGFRMGRVVTAIAFAGVFVFAAACTDSTAPKEVTPTPVTPPPETPVPAAMVSVAGELDGMTTQFMSSLDDDATNQAKLAGALSGLKGHLLAGNVLLCQQDVTAAHGIIDSLDDDHQIGLAPIGLALDVVVDVLSTIK
jgi:hypothetical protein